MTCVGEIEGQQGGIDLQPNACEAKQSNPGNYVLSVTASKSGVT